LYIVCDISEDGVAGRQVGTDTNGTTKRRHYPSVFGPNREMPLGNMLQLAIKSNPADHGPSIISGQRRVLTVKNTDRPVERETFKEQGCDLCFKSLDIDVGRSNLNSIGRRIQEC